MVGRVFTCLWLAGCVWDVSGSLRVKPTTKAEKEHKNSHCLFSWNRGCFHCFQNPSICSSPPQYTHIESAIEFQTPLGCSSHESFIPRYFTLVLQTLKTFLTLHPGCVCVCVCVYIKTYLGTSFFSHAKRQFPECLQESNGSLRL